VGLARHRGGEVYFSAGGVLVMTREDLDALGAELMAADDAADPQRLAAIAWQLYSEAGVSLGEIERLHGVLRALHARGGSPPLQARS
jgi:hypothetical protein